MAKVEEPIQQWKIHPAPFHPRRSNFRPVFPLLDVVTVLSSITELGSVTVLGSFTEVYSVSVLHSYAVLQY